MLLWIKSTTITLLLRWVRNYFSSDRDMIELVGFGAVDSMASIISFMRHPELDPLDGVFPQEPTREVHEGNRKTAVAIPFGWRISRYDERELHIFADASEKAIAAVVFLRTWPSSGIDTSMVLGKAKATPKHALTMPRLELCATLPAV